jgi:hypothetical protein
VSATATAADLFNNTPLGEAARHAIEKAVQERTPHADGVRTMSKDEIDRLGDSNLGNVAPIVAPRTR